MASKEERIQSEYIRELMEITNCCICNTTVKDPRILPCIHTFCLKCLKSKVADSDSTTTDIVVCPLCKSEFKIPESGFVGLQKNFFVERLATICEALSKLTILNICDICCENVNPSNSTDIRVVEAYCKACDIRMCRNCCKQHRVSKPTKAHKLYTLQGSDTLNSSTEEIAACFCDEHQNERLKIYCTDCNNALCALCYIELHEGHKWLYLNKAADEFRCEMKTIIDCLVDSEMTKRLKNFEIEKLDFQQKIESIHKNTETARIQIKDVIDKHAEAIFERIDSLKRRRETYIQSEHNDLLRVKSILERFRNYCQDITTKGSIIDICRSIGDLRMNFTDLMQLKDSANEKCFHPFEEQEFLEILNSEDYNFFRRFHGEIPSSITLITL